MAYIVFRIASECERPQLSVPIYEVNVLEFCRQYSPLSHGLYTTPKPHTGECWQSGGHQRG